MVRVSVTLQGDGERRINASSQMGEKREPSWLQELTLGFCALELEAGQRIFS